MVSLFVKDLREGNLRIPGGDKLKDSALLGNLKLRKVNQDISPRDRRVPIIVTIRKA